ncbi:MAG: hypothetical protein BGO87_11175 [Flavobacteriia bacterium 40-80]|nr:MAG: hypothetical protein BGO87_11175 [Flavobacteriia bacterium 40-80]
MIKRILFLNLMLLLSIGFTFSQKDKIKIDNDIVLVNNIPVFKLKTFQMQTFTLYDLNDTKLAIFNCLDYYDSKEISSGNPKGRVVYFDVTFLNDDTDKCEIPCNGFKKQLAQYIQEYGLVKEGKLDETAVKQFVKIHGNKFSDVRNRSTTIIIQR